MGAYEGVLVEGERSLEKSGDRLPTGDITSHSQPPKPFVLPRAAC